MTAPRIVVPGATLAITRRTTMRKGFLGPWHADVGKASLYSLAYAQHKTGVAVHHFIDVITHHHLTITLSEPNLPEFLERFHHDKSCALNTLLARERYDQPGELFDDRSAHAMRLCDAPSQSTNVSYGHLNCVAAGLVDRPEHMPGYVFSFDLWKSGYIEVKRPDFYFSDNRPEVLRLELTPPPLLYAAFDGDLDALVFHMKRVAEDTRRELRPHHSRPALGARRVMRLHPWSEPRTLRETRGKRLPTFRIGARGIVGRETHIEAARETHAFRSGHRGALVAWAGGDRDAVFPYGTYQMRVKHGAAVAEPPEVGGGIVCMPGPSLCDVQAVLDAEHARRRAQGGVVNSDARFALMDETREALREEAHELCAHAADAMDFEAAQPGAAGAAPVSATAEDRDEASVVVRHRFARSRDGRDAGARRVVTLRDRRMGRPRSRRHGNDPPA